MTIGTVPQDRAAVRRATEQLCSVQLCSEQRCREVYRQVRSMASFKISGHTGLLHRWARGPSVQQTWRRIAASMGQGPVSGAVSGDAYVDCSLQLALTNFSILHTLDVG